MAGRSKYPSVRIGGLVVGQYPNPPLLVALAAAVVSWIAEEGGTIHDVSRAVFYVALTVWGWEEASRGVNSFRRALGVIAIAYVIVAMARAFS